MFFLICSFKTDEYIRFKQVYTENREALKLIEFYEVLDISYVLIPINSNIQWLISKVEREALIETMRTPEEISISFKIGVYRKTLSTEKSQPVHCNVEHILTEYEKNQLIDYLSFVKVGAPLRLQIPVFFPKFLKVMAIKHPNIGYYIMIIF